MLRALDGFDLTDGPGSMLKYIPIGGARGGIAAGRYDGQALGLFNTGFGESNYVKVLDSQPTWIWGMDFRFFTSFSQGFVKSEWFRWSSPTQILFSLRSRTDGKMDFLRGSGNLAPILATTPAFTMGQWKYLEMKLQVGQHGSYSLRADGVEIIGDHNIDLGIGQPDRLAFRWQSLGTSGYHLDNYYICDGQGTSFNDFLGPSRITSHYPTALYGATPWLVRPTSPVYTEVQAVSDRSIPLGGLAFGYPDGDNVYLLSQALGDSALFGLTTPACFGLILAAALNLCAKPGAPNQTIDAVVDQRGVLSQLGLSLPMSDSGSTLEPNNTKLFGYRTYQAIAPLSLDTGFAWSDSELASAGWGARAGAAQTRLTQAYLEKLVTLDTSQRFDCGPGNYSY